MFERLRALPIRPALTLAGVAIAIFCIVVVGIWALFFQVSYATLFTSLRPADAVAIVADLDRKKIPYRLTDGGATILVPADILDEQGRIMGASPRVRAEPTALSPADEARRAIEQYYQARARLALDHAFPLAALTIAVSARGANAADWDPAARTFPLAITIVSSNVVDDAMRAKVKTLAATAIGADPDKGDTVAFRVQAPAARARALSPAWAMHGIGASDVLPVAGEGVMPLVLSVVLFLALVGLTAAVLRHLSRPRRPADARTALAAKFREILGDGERDAA